MAADLHYAVACDNGALAAATSTSSSPSPLASCPVPAAGGSHTIRGRIIDKDEGFSEYSATVKMPARVQVYLPVVWFSGTDAPRPMQQVAPQSSSTGSKDRGR